MHKSSFNTLLSSKELTRQFRVLFLSLLWVLSFTKVKIQRNTLTFLGTLKFQMKLIKKPSDISVVVKLVDQRFNRKLVYSLEGPYLAILSINETRSCKQITPQSPI